MKSPVKIFVEGDADERFISQLIEHLFGEIVEKKSIVVTNGWTRLLSPSTEGTYLNEMRKNSAYGGVNLVIFDADDNIVQRRTDILSWKARHNVEFELFLIPDDSAQGALEELLERIINEENKPVMDCWFGYERSLMEVKLPWKNGESLTIPAKKTKIYAYLEVLLGKERSQKNLIKEKHRIYHNENHWNLNADALRPLSNFLKNNL